MEEHDERISTVSLLHKYKQRLKKEPPKQKPKKKAPKWTHEIRVCLFKLVKEEFGSAENYLKSPLSLQKQFSKQVAEQLSNKYEESYGQTYSEGGPFAQIAWALTNQTQIKNLGHVRDYFFCKAAALESGLIKTKDIPSKLEFLKK